MKLDDVPQSMRRMMSAADKKHFGIHDHHPQRSVPNPKPQHNQAPALAATDAGEAKGFRGTVVRFTLFRVQPLDPDNAAGSVKDLLDGLRHAQLISGDEYWRIKLEVAQVKVGKYADENTKIAVSDQG